MHINLLPPNTRLKIQFRCVLHRYLLVWSIASFAVAVHAGSQIKNIYDVRCQLAGLDMRCQPVYAMEESIHRARHELTLLRAHLDRLREAEPTDHTLELLGVLGQAAKSAAGKLVLQRVSLQDGQAVPAISTPVAADQAKRAAAPKTLTTVSLSGVADDDVTLTQFISSLRQSGVFEHVSLKASSQAAGSERLSRQYQLECRYEDAP